MMRVNLPKLSFYCCLLLFMYMLFCPIIRKNAYEEEIYMKRFLKKVITVFVVVMMAISVMPMTQADAAVRLSASKKTVYVGESFTLKVSGTSKTVKWSSSKKSVASVTQKGKVTAKKAGKATITAKVSGKSLKCKVTAKESSNLKGKSAKEAINTINNWYIGDVWNNFVDFQSYRQTGLDCTGSKIDIDFAYKNFKKSYKLKKEYDAYIQSLGSDYSEIKDTWFLMKEQIEIIYADLEENGLENDGSYLDLDLLGQYSDHFYGVVNELVYGL